MMNCKKRARFSRWKRNLLWKNVINYTNNVLKCTYQDSPTFPPLYFAKASSQSPIITQLKSFRRSHILLILSINLVSQSNLAKFTLSMFANRNEANEHHTTQIRTYSEYAHQNMCVCLFKHNEIATKRKVRKWEETPKR